jgi:hypothetical protein
MTPSHSSHGWLVDLAAEPAIVGGIKTFLGVADIVAHA